MTTFRFSPGCCCGGEETNVCIPDCSLVFHDILLDTDIDTVYAAMLAARECSGEPFWHGFEVSFGSHSAAGPITSQFVKPGAVNAGDVIGSANALFYVVGYALDARTRRAYMTASQSVANTKRHISLAQNATDTAAEVANYFVYSRVDSAWHYKPSVTEPAWVQVEVCPFDYSSNQFHFTAAGDTAADYEAAPPVGLANPPGADSVDDLYLTAAECGLPAYQVRTDFTSIADAQAVYHSGTVGNIWVDGDDLSAWVASLADGTHHYGTERIYLCRVGAEKTGWTSTAYGTHVSAFSEIVEGRFYRDKPTFTPMLPSGVYAGDCVEPVPVSGGTISLVHTNGKPADVPLLWDTDPTSGSSEYFGRFIAAGCGVSHYEPSPAPTVYNGYFPIARATYTPPYQYSMMGNDPMIDVKTGAAMIAQSKNRVTVNNFTYTDFADAVSSRGSTGNLLTRLGKSSYNGIFGFYQIPPFLVYGTKPATPSGLAHNGKVFVHGGAGNTYESHNGQPYAILKSTPTDNPGTYTELTNASQTSGWIASRAPASGDIVCTSSAAWYNYTIPGGNETMKIHPITSMRSVLDGQGNTVYFPSIPDAQVDAIFGSGAWCVGPIISEQAQSGLTYHVFIYVWAGVVIY